MTLHRQMRLTADVERATTTDADGGYQEATWAVVARKVRCAIQPRSRTAPLNAHGRQTSEDHFAAVKASVDVLPDDRLTNVRRQGTVVNSGTTYTVQSVEDIAMRGKYKRLGLTIGRVTR